MAADGGTAGSDVASLIDRLFVPAKEHFDLDSRLSDVDAVYRPLAKWVASQARGPHPPAALGAPDVSCDFPPLRDGRSRTKQGPLVVGVAGGIAAGKTSVAELLAQLLVEAPHSEDGALRVAVISADGFLYPNAELAARGLSARKGFPESYDTAALFGALAALKAGLPVVVPHYSHLSYDVVPGVLLDPPDVVVIEGIIVLQTPPQAATLPSDSIDLGVYIDASESDLRRWYGERLAELFAEARHEPASFYHQWSAWDADEIAGFADAVWEGINLSNLRDHIAPSRLRADVILQKRADHRVSQVLVRRR